jgi:hypothetical protein
LKIQKRGKNAYLGPSSETMCLFDGPAIAERALNGSPVGDGTVVLTPSTTVVSIPVPIGNPGEGGCTEPRVGTSIQAGKWPSFTGGEGRSAPSPLTVVAEDILECEAEKDEEANDDTLLWLSESLCRGISLLRVSKYVSCLRIISSRSSLGDLRGTYRPVCALDVGVEPLEWTASCDRSEELDLEWSLGPEPWPDELSASEP